MGHELVAQEQYAVSDNCLCIYANVLFRSERRLHHLFSNGRTHLVAVDEELITPPPSLLRT
jgi:hypothetical protein